MRIAIFLPDLRGGGAERTVVNLLKEWTGGEPSLDLDLVLVRAVGVLLPEVPESIRVIDLGSKRSILAIPALRRYIKYNKPDVLISHLSHLNVLALLVKKLFCPALRIILVEHALLSPDRSQGKERWVRWLMKKWYPSVPLLVAVSDYVARDLERELGIPAGKVRTIYNPVSGRDIVEKAKTVPRHPWLQEKDRPVFLGVGRLVPEKGWDTLLKAFSMLRRQRSARLIILGEGECRESLEQEMRRLGLEEDVQMPGFEGNPYSYMGHCDALVISSWWEALPGALIEAMACGCPVIVTDVPGGIREILGDGGSGILVPVKDEEAMAAAMLKILENPADVEELRNRAGVFSGERAALAYLALLKEQGIIPALPDREASAGARADRGILPGRRVVLHMITGLHTGGAEMMLCQLLSSMDRRRWEPVVLSLTDGSRPEACLREQGIPVYNLGMPRGKIPSPAVAIKLIRLVHRIRPDLIHGWMYHGNLAAQLANFFLFRRARVLWSIHHSIGSTGALSAEKKMTAGVIRLGARLSWLPDKIVYASRVSREQHVDLGYNDRKACTIPNGVDPDVFIQVPGSGEELRMQLGLPVPGLVIGSLARYHPIKDHENFFRAAALLCSRPEGKDVQFLLAGSGVDLGNPYLRRLIGELGIGDRVHLLGERSDTAQLLNAMDLFTVSSYGEALPMVLLEAMSCELPCVTTDVGDAGLAVGDTGRVVPRRDPEALAGAWAELISAGKEKRRALGKAARQKIINNYTLKVCAVAYEELYRSLAD
jgi:glycosyltransferase involved in cell wall biosynthesis